MSAWTSDILQSPDVAALTLRTQGGNADINLTPDGTGAINLSSATVSMGALPLDNTTTSALGIQLSGNLVTVPVAAGGSDAGSETVHFLTDSNYYIIPNNNYIHWSRTGSTVTCSYQSDVAGIASGGAEATFVLPVARSTPFTDVNQCSGVVLTTDGIPSTGFFDAVVGTTDTVHSTVYRTITGASTLAGSFVYTLS